MRSLSPLYSVAAICALAAPAAAQAQVDVHTLKHEGSEPKLHDAARALFAKADEARFAQGIEPLYWSEFSAVILREHLEDLLARGWRGGPLPQGTVDLQARGKAVHGAGVPFACAYGNFAAGALDAKAVLGGMKDPNFESSLIDPKMRLAAAAVREVDGKWFALIGIVPFADAHKKTAEGNDALAPFFRRAEHADKAQRLLGIDALRQAETQETLPYLRSSLIHDDAEIRAAAARALGGIKSRGVPQLLLHALTDAEASVQEAALDGLAAWANAVGATGAERDADKWRAWWKANRPKLHVQFGFKVPTITEPLEALLEGWQEATKKRDTIRQVEILKALREHPEAKDKRAVKLMLNALKQKPKEVFYEACRACAWHKLKKAVSPLLALAKANDNKKDPERGKVIVLALGNIGDLRALDFITDSPWSSKDGEVFWLRCMVARYFRANKSVDWLISLITIAERDQIKHYAKPIVESLEHLTGETFGEDGRAWKDWWKKNKRFRPEPLPDDY
ncbi:MAG: HEAT repeat domain-containing protein, partial [Planctomycetota bacterium]